MEPLFLERVELHLSPLGDKRSRLRALASARALISNLDSSDSTRRAVVDAVARALDQNAGDPAFLRCALALLGEAAALHRLLVPAIVGAIRSFLDGSGGQSAAADALAVLASIPGPGARGGEDGGEGGVPSLIDSVLDEDVILSLASSPRVAVRSQILGFLVSSLGRDPSSKLLRSHLMLRVLVGLASDLYPSVRSAALDGLVAFCKEVGHDVHGSIIECCYNRAIELSLDEDELVRLAAVRLVSACGHVFAASKDETDSSRRMDMIFVQLCSMARDMSVKVRTEAFIALGEVRMVSESVLLQSLSKKTVAIKSGSKPLSESSAKESVLQMSCGAGVFVHGIEDEFYEVRMAACKSLGMLTNISIQFADNALNLLMDMLNDDAEAVRLQTLQTLFHMATHGRLMVQEKHMHMFLGLLADTSALIRCAARKLLRLMKLPDRDTFELTTNCLITNLETHPEEENGIFLVLFFMGKNHKKFSAKLVKKFAQEIVTPCEGELSLDSPRVAAFMVLTISLSFQYGPHINEIPPVTFSYTIPFVGRISHALGGSVDQDSLLVCLSRLCGMPFSAMSKSEVAIQPSNVNINENALDLSELSTTLEQSQHKGQYLDEDLLQTIKLILGAVTEVWSLVKFHRAHDMRRILRACQEELDMISWNADGSGSSVLDFAIQYVQVIQLIAEIWEHLQLKKSYVNGMLITDILLERLDMTLRRLRYTFPRLCREEECHILELTLLSFVFRLSKVGICSGLMMNKLHAVICRIEFLCADGSSKLSDFVRELAKCCTEGITSKDSYPVPVDKLVDLFHLEQMPLTGRFRCIKAELQALGNDSENPLLFVSELPVGITFQVILYSTSDEDKLWLRMTVGDTIQYVFLDLCRFGGSDNLRNCTVTIPFYATPKSASFLLRACICMECPGDGIITCLKFGKGGPQDDIVVLCEETDVYLVNIDNK